MEKIEIMELNNGTKVMTVQTEKTRDFILGILGKMQDENLSIREVTMVACGLLRCVEKIEADNREKIPFTFR